MGDFVNKLLEIFSLPKVLFLECIWFSIWKEDGCVIVKKRIFEKKKNAMQKL